MSDIAALHRIARELDDFEPTDIQAGLDFALEIIEDDPDRPFDPLPLDERTDEAVRDFIYALWEVADDFRQMYQKRIGNQHRKVYWDLLQDSVVGLDDAPCPQPCRACLAEADARAGVYAEAKCRCGDCAANDEDEDSGPEDD